jgi:hypothetical protein
MANDAALTLYNIRYSVGTLFFLRETRYPRDLRCREAIKLPDFNVSRLLEDMKRWGNGRTSVKSVCYRERESEREREREREKQEGQEEVPAVLDPKT